MFKLIIISLVFNSTNGQMITDITEDNFNTIQECQTASSLINVHQAKLSFGTYSITSFCETKND